MKSILRSALPFVAAVSGCIIVIFTTKGYGITMDEPAYFWSGKYYATWMLGVSDMPFDATWSENHEHPPLAKYSIGVSYYLLRDKLNSMDPVSAFRAGVLPFVFLLLFVFTKWAIRLAGTKAAVLALLSLLFAPRIFYQMHIASLDLPTAAVWMTAAYLFTTVRKYFWRVLTVSVAIGMAFLTKINATFVTVPIGLFALYRWRNDPGRRPSKRWRHAFELAAYAVVPLVMLYTLWPWLWPDPIARTIEYLDVYVYHPFHHVYYFGRTYTHVPWHYPLVMLFITTPVVPLIAAGIGVIYLLKRRTSQSWYVVGNAVFPIFLASLPAVRKFDGIRHFLTGVVFLLLVSSVGYAELMSWFARTRAGRRIGFGVLLLAILVTVVGVCVRDHPYQDSYFNILVGGPAGAERIGFDIDYAGNAYAALLPWMNAHPRYRYCIEPFPYIFYSYKKFGLLNPSVTTDGFYGASCDFKILLSRQGFFDYFGGWNLYGKQAPVMRVTLNGAQLVGVYR